MVYGPLRRERDLVKSYDVSYRIIRPGRTTLRTNSGTDYQQQSRAALV